MAHKKQAKNSRHVLTVRMDDADFRHLQLAQVRIQREQRRSKVTYTEIIVGQIRDLPR